MSQLPDDCIILMEAFDMNSKNILPSQAAKPGSVCPFLCNFWKVSHEAEAACAEMVSIHLYLSGSLLMLQFFLPSTQKI